MRCLLFSSNERTAQPILQVLAGLDVEGELCSEGAAAVEKVSRQSFQIVIIDWDMQPEAALLLTSARERKAADRPLTLAIVSDDLGVPKALQAGANSILHQPLLASQIRDTLTTARDLLRARQESATNAAQAAAAGASAGVAAAGPAAALSTLPANLDPRNERSLRAGEFLQSAPSAPGGQFVTDSDVPEFGVSSPVEKDLEPVAASVREETSPDPTPPETSEVRGLEWYLKTRAGIVPQASAQAAARATAVPSAPPGQAKPELLSFDQTPSFSPSSFSPAGTTAAGSAPARSAPAGFPAAASDEADGSASPETNGSLPGSPAQKTESSREQKKEVELFAHIAGGSGESEKAPRQPFPLRGAILGALALASLAMVAAPQAPWHAKVRGAWGRGRQTVHAWLNPQLVTTPQAPITHEDFGRAGDEYKLPATANIPDATTDPSQIQVLPVVDPTVKKPNLMGENAEGTAQPDAAGAAATDPAAVPGAPPAGAQPAPATAQPVNGVPAGGTSASPAGSPTLALPGSTSAASNSSGSTPPGAAAPGSSPVSTLPMATPTAAPAPDSPAPASPSAVFPSATPSSTFGTTPQPAQPKAQAQFAPASTPANVPSSLKSKMTSTPPDASGNRPVDSAMPSIEPVAVAEATERALLTSQTTLEYPANASGQPGTVVLQVVIGRDGSVQDAKFLQGSLAYARNAIDGVQRWKFKPYIVNGRPVSVQTLLTISFKPAP